MDQIPPNKPAYLSLADYEFILDRDKRRCVFHSKCPKAGGNAYCSLKLDFDHEQPEELGGDSSVANVRLLCESENRGRVLRPTLYWAELNYWDDIVDPTRLRQIQRLAAWDELEKIAFGDSRELRRKLLRSTTLLTGATGIGKTLLQQSILFKINSMIGAGYPRIRHILWLTNDTELRDSTAEELKTESVKPEIGFAKRPPTVRIAKSFSDLLRGPLRVDVTISAIQSLWDVETKGAPRHTDEETRRVLLQYDCIVFDECDWGNDQVLRIAVFANHAFQFAMTATPVIPALFKDVNRAKEFIKRFVIISPDAIADYQRALKLDGCLKQITKAEVKGLHPRFHALSGGARTIAQGTAGPDHASYRAAILEVAKDADFAETRMRQLSPDNYFSPHVMVRLGSIRAIRSMYDDLKEEFRRRSDFDNPGWDVTMVYAGHHRRVLSLPERTDLSTKVSGRFVNPFMLAQNNGGRASDQSMRVLLMCNIGERGFNHWPISYMVDCTDNSFGNDADLVHFAYGRAIRWREKDRGDWHSHQDLKEFATSYVSIPHTDFESDKLTNLNSAFDFIMNMNQHIRDAGFKTWEDLISGIIKVDEEIKLDGSNRPLTDVEKYIVQGKMAEGLQASGTLSEEWIEPMIDISFSEQSPRVRDKLKDYAKRLVKSPNFRRHEILANPPVSIKTDALAVVEQLVPPDKYEIDDLIKHIRSSPEYDGERDLYIQALANPNAVDPNAAALFRLAHDTVSKNLRRIQRLNRGRAHRVYHLHNEDGIFWELFGELFQKFREAGDTVEKRLVYPAVIGATTTLYDIKNADDDGPLDQPPYHIAMLGRHRKTILAMARGWLIRDGSLGANLQRLAQT